MNRFDNCTVNSGSDFSGVKVGDRLWLRDACREKWVTVIRIEYGLDFPVIISDCGGYTYGGSHVLDGPQVLFYDKVEIIPPPRPKRMVKKTVMVRPFRHSNGRVGLDYSQEFNQVLEHYYCGPAQTIEIEVEE